MQHGLAALLPGLTELNPLLRDRFQESPSGQRRTTAHRQQAPRSAGDVDGDAQADGVSAFAFQGTNAHIILAAAAPGRALEFPVRSPAWQRRRCWFGPPPHALLQRASSGLPVKGIAQECAFHCPTAAPRLALLWDHVVAGRALVPGACMLEACHAATQRALAVESASGTPGSGGAGGLAPGSWGPAG